MQTEGVAEWWSLLFHSESPGREQDLLRWAAFALTQDTHAICLQAVALFGSLIMPHNIYLHSALVGRGS